MSGIYTPQYSHTIVYKRISPQKHPAIMTQMTLKPVFTLQPEMAFTQHYSTPKQWMPSQKYLHQPVGPSSAQRRRN